MSLKCRKCPACVFVDELAPAMLPSQFCEEHAGMSLPLGPDGRIVVPVRRGNNHQRWHEIATEGLPPIEMKGLAFWIYGKSMEPPVLLAAWAARTHKVDPWDVLIGDPYANVDDDGDDAGRVTHWMPCPLPAPPTKEPR